jgi:hypothetical protein
MDCWANDARAVLPMVTGYLPGYRVAYFPSFLSIIGQNCLINTVRNEKDIVPFFAACVYAGL